MVDENDFLSGLNARLAALIADQKRLLEVIRKEQAELVRVDLHANPSAMPTTAQTS
jgi:hypothetical protein